MPKGSGEGPSSRDQPDYKTEARMFSSVMNSTKLAVLFLLCMQNTLFTVLRRYSQGVLREEYSKVRAAGRETPHTSLRETNDLASSPHRHAMTELVSALENSMKFYSWES